MRAVVALGSNIAPRERYLAAAIEKLSLLPCTRLIGESTPIETEPVDVPDEFADCKFLNQAAVFETALGPDEFSRRMHEIETALGRVRTVRNGPRTIDLDLVDFGGLVRSSPELILPHPRAKQRDFVLVPLQELGVSLDWTLADVRQELQCGNRVVLFVRHAERPRIEADDTTFGDQLPLTAVGVETSRDFGRLIAGAAREIAFRASPLRRTVMTAECIAEGMGIAAPRIITDELIGNGSAFVESEFKVWELFRDGRFFEHMRKWLSNGTQYGFNELYAAADRFEEYALSVFSAQLGVFATHDVYVAAFAHARGVRVDFCEENWPRFLDAAAIVVEPDGKRRYGFVRAGLSEHCRGVSDPCASDSSSTAEGLRV